MAGSSSDLPFSKISISGPILSALLRHSSDSSSVAGLLFGHITALPSPDPTDADPTPSLSSPLLSLTITSFVSSHSPLPFFGPLGHVDPTSLLLPPNPNPSSGLVGWFSSRSRSRSPLRPSMRELAASHHLAQTLTLTPQIRPKTCIFLLLSFFSTTNQAVHTHEYRAFVLASARPRPISVDVVNVGPTFRGQYGAFSPESSAVGFPLMTCRARISEEGEGYMETESRDGGENVTMDWSVDGFGVERLEELMGERAAEYARELEELYAKMIGKLEVLVRLMEESSAKVQEQENQNSVLRRKIAGVE